MENDNFYEYALDLEQQWQASLPRYTGKELLEIFPEAKTVLSEKISEWQQARDEHSDTIKKELTTIKYSDADDFSKWFWREWIKINYGHRLLAVDAHISRLKGLIWMSKGKPPDRWIAREQIDQALAVPLENIVGQLMRRSGKLLVGLCPLHKEKTPSFFIYPKNNSCWCYGCHQGGDTITFMRLLHGCSFREAVGYLVK